MATPEELEVRHFEDLVGETFRLDLGEGEEAELELTEVALLGERDPGERRVRTRPFSLLFRGPRDPLLAQAIHRLSHPQLGERDIFLVPVSRDSRGTLYEAVFT